jgi:hypothetical protein
MALTGTSLWSWLICSRGTRKRIRRVAVNQTMHAMKETARVLSAHLGSAFLNVTLGKRDILHAAFVVEAL